MKTVKGFGLLMLLLSFGGIAHAVREPLPTPGTYPSEYTCFAYPMVFEDGTLSSDEKLLILRDYTGLWMVSPPSESYEQDSAIIMLSGGVDVTLHKVAYQESPPPAGGKIYEDELNQFGLIDGFGYVLVVSKVLSDGYRSKMQLPDFATAYAALDGFVYMMNHLEETEYKKAGDIMYFDGVEGDLDFAINTDIRYLVEGAKGMQFRHASILNFRFGGDELPNQLISEMEVWRSDSVYPGWEDWFIIYDQDRWKMYLNFKIP